MAEEDEIDILGDFSFNSCFAQNNQGIPSCSSREDTVHPEWLLDSTATNWFKDGPSRKLMGSSSINGIVKNTILNQEKEILMNKRMIKHARNVSKISQTLKAKTDMEMQALTKIKNGVIMDEDSKNNDRRDTPTVGREEIVTDQINNVLDTVTTGSPTITLPNKQVLKKKNYVQSKNSLLRPDILDDAETNASVKSSQIFYDDELTIGSTESIGSELDITDIVSKNIVKYQAKAKAERKIGNHRRKVSRNYDKKPRNKSKDLQKSPQGRQRKDSSLSDDTVRSPKMQIVLGSGQALPVSEGEQVIKIEKKKDSEPESDIDIDVDSDNEDKDKIKTKKKPTTNVISDDAPIAVPLRKFEPLPKRHKKINLDGGGGYTIMHTAAGDLYAVGAEPRRERLPRRQPEQLIQCRLYSAERPAPYEVRLHVSALILMDAHAHTSRAEVMGLAGGGAAGGALRVRAYRPAAAAAGTTHCDMEPVSQSAAAERLRSAGAAACGWHHSHPRFPPAPSLVDLRSQRALQAALERAHRPFLSLITSQHWPTGRTASQYRCIRVEDEEGSDTPIGYQFSVKLDADLTLDNLEPFLGELRDVMRNHSGRDEYRVDMTKDVCPQAGITYLEKCVSSVSHHMRSAGYAEDDPVVPQLIQGLRDVFR